MAKHGIAQLRFEEGLVERRNPAAHDVWLDDHFTGLLELRLTTLPGRFVSPGTGRLTLLAEGGGEVVAQEAAKARGVPVIPGSGIKGAVRTLYEILSSSCDPHRRGDCQRSHKRRHFSEREYCDACSLFGCMGWRGRVTFSDAVPAATVNAGIHWVAIPWEPHGEKTRGDFRLYDLDEAIAVDRTTGHRSPAPKELAREGYDGKFITRLSFWNVTGEELGRLLLAMGVAAEEAAGFPLRLGGCKYDGQGAVRVEPVGASLVRPRRQELERDGLRELASGWMKAATASPWGQAFAPKLRELAKILKPETT